MLGVRTKKWLVSLSGLLTVGLISVNPVVPGLAWLCVVAAVLVGVIAYHWFARELCVHGIEIHPLSAVTEGRCWCCGNKTDKALCAECALREVPDGR